MMTRMMCKDPSHLDYHSWNWTGHSLRPRILVVVFVPSGSTPNYCPCDYYTLACGSTLIPQELTTSSLPPVQHRMSSTARQSSHSSRRDIQSSSSTSSHARSDRSSRPQHSVCTLFLMYPIFQRLRPAFYSPRSNQPLLAF